MVPERNSKILPELKEYNKCGRKKKFFSFSFLAPKSKTKNRSSVKPNDKRHLIRREGRNGKF
jgi:hypothetical protein